MALIIIGIIVSIYLLALSLPWMFSSVEWSTNASRQFFDLPLPTNE